MMPVYCMLQINLGSVCNFSASLFLKRQIFQSWLILNELTLNSLEGQSFSWNCTPTIMHASFLLVFRGFEGAFSRESG